MSADLNTIIEAIQKLTPMQRRQLQRRLRTSGLLSTDELVTDRNRLRVVSTPRLQTLLQAQPPLKNHLKSLKSPVKIPVKIPVKAPAKAPDKGSTDGPNELPISDHYESPVSGKVVLGTPETIPAPKEDDPHAMLPLPGLAPTEPIEIIFDGGSRGNPGQGYGSYLLRWPGQPDQIVRLHFGDRVTNNEAEYDTLITALETTLQRLADQGTDLRTAQLQAYGDSLLVINQIQGIWRCKNPRMKLRCERAQALIQQFGRWELTHHRREKSVEALGH